MSEPRKATDVLLSLESKLEVLLGMVRAQDLTIKILSNKLNEVKAALEKQPQSKPTAEAVQAPRVPQSLLQHVPLDPERQVPIFAESKLPITDAPQGFRRTSRPETFAGDDVYLKQEQSSQVAAKSKMLKPPPGREAAEVMVPETPPPKQQKQTVSQNKKAPPIVQNAIPVMQRIVDKTGKSIFLADVEVIDATTSQPVFKTRTNGTGKWMASLEAGNYHVTINKRGSSISGGIKAEQDIYIDGSQSPLELSTMIIK